MRISFTADDRLIAAVGGAVAGLGCIAAALVTTRGSARVQASRSALLGRPTAYRLHLHGTGLQFAPWERNYVAECVLRGWPKDGVYVGPDVKPRPDEGGSVFRDSAFIGDPRLPGDTALRWDVPGGHEPEDEDEGLSDDEAEAPVADSPVFYLPAHCPNGHHFPAVSFTWLRDDSALTLRTPVLVDCPECDDGGMVEPGRYSISGGSRVVREDVPPEGDC